MAKKNTPLDDVLIHVHTKYLALSYSMMINYEKLGYMASKTRDRESDESRGCTLLTRADKLGTRVDGMPVRIALFGKINVSARVKAPLNKSGRGLEAVAIAGSNKLSIHFISIRVFYFLFMFVEPVHTFPRCS